MRVLNLGNAVEVVNIDLMDDEACLELGHLVAKENVVLLRQAVSEQRLYDIHMLWGSPYLGFILEPVIRRDVSGRHWRSVQASANRIGSKLEGHERNQGMARVSAQQDKRGNPTGIFMNGELNWHADLQTVFDVQKIVGLMSLWGTKNTQTAYLCTAPAYDALSKEDRTMVDELITISRWDGGAMSRDLIQSQLDIVRSQIVPIDGMECPLMMKTNNGQAGMRFPTHSFHGFKGMSQAESLKFRDHLWEQINRPEYIYVHDWEDGQIMFMDQQITLHARPTAIKAGDERTLCRVSSYLDHLYPDYPAANYGFYDGEKLDRAALIALADEKKKAEFNAHRR